MNKKNKKTALTTTALALALLFGASVAGAQTILGPANPTADSAAYGSAGAEWNFGEAANAWADATDGGGFIENTGTFNIGATDTNEGSVDFRSNTFSLGAAADGAMPVDFSFNFKFLEAVGADQGIRVDLRFWADQGGEDFQGEDVVFIGTNGVGDTQLLDEWQSYSKEAINVPGGAFYADIRATVNDFAPWDSGGAQFDNFAVVPEPRTYALIGGILALGATLLRRRLSRR